MSAVVAASLLQSIGAARQHSPTPRTPQSQVTFRLDVSYIEVDAVVTDGQGAFVRDLQPSEVEVLEDGRPQVLSHFSLVDIASDRSGPRRDPPLPAMLPDVADNRTAFDGRLYVLVLDDLHTHPLRSQAVRLAARRFVEEYLGASDLAAVMHTSGLAGGGQSFSADPRRLLGAIDRFVGRKSRSATLERLDTFFSRTRPPDEEFNSVRIDDPLDMERAETARVALETIARVGTWMASLRGRRKALLFFSEGIDHDLYALSDGHVAAAVPALARDAIAAAARTNIGIYAVDPRGATALGDEVMEIGELPSPEYHKLDLGAGGLQREVRRSQDSLRVLAEETGGFAALDTNGVREVFERVVRDNSAYYMLGYHSNDTRRDGRFRTIDVRVRRPGARVRARRGYVAPRGAARESQPLPSGTASPALREALLNPLPVTALPMSVFAAPFRDATRASVLVAVEIEGRDMPFAERGGLFTNEVELSLAALDDGGRLRDGSQINVPFRLRPETREAVARHGLRLTSRITLPPGRYQLRVAALERVGGRTGSVHYDLDVPDYSNGGLAMSGLVLTAASARHTPTPQPDERLAGALPAPPTTRREFALTDGLALFVEIYDHAAFGPRGLDVVTTLRAADGRLAFRAVQTRRPEVLEGLVPDGGYGYSARVPLKDLAPGWYVLRVEARAETGGDPPAFRETRIRLVPG
jgi:VWFA-related protein